MPRYAQLKFTDAEFVKFKIAVAESGKSIEEFLKSAVSEKIKSDAAKSKAGNTSLFANYLKGEVK